MKKPFKETAVGKFISEKVPNLIGVIENFVPAPIKGGLDIIKKLINDDPDMKPEDKAKALQLAEEHELAMLKEEDDLKKAELDADEKDLENSRNREIALATSDKAPLINKIATPLLAFFITVAFFWLLGYLCKYSVPASNKDILNIMLGSLGTAWIGVVGYYFHSSMGSKAKDEQIAKMMSVK